MWILGFLNGCFGIGAITQAIYDPAAAQAQVDAAILAQVDATRATYEAAPSCATAHSWAGMVQAAIDGGLYARGALALADIDAAIAALPETGDDAWMCLADRGMLYASTARPTEARAALESSLSKRQGAYALNLLLPLAPTEAPARCKTAYAAQKTDDERLLILNTCAPYDPSLAWAPSAGKALYKKDQEARAAEAAARQAAQQAAAQQAAQSQPVYSYSGSSSSASAGSSSGSSAPAAPTTTSVRLHNDCSKTVKLFFGSKPKYGSGTYSTLGANTTESRTMKPGDMIWIVDDSQNGLSSVTVSGSSMSVDVTSSCNGFRTH